MRGTDNQQSSMFSYISAERRVSGDHPQRAIRMMADTALSGLIESLDRMYAVDGRPSTSGPAAMALRPCLVSATGLRDLNLVENRDRVLPYPAGRFSTRINSSGHCVCS
jgi:hypothetical protein